MTVFVVLPVHNRIEMTIQFLDSLESQSADEAIEVVVIDDGSSDGTSARLTQSQYPFPIHILHGNGQLWWGGSVWKASQWLRTRAQSSDWIFLANNDTILDHKCLGFSLETARTHPGALVGGRSFEIWPDGTHHPVSSGFTIDTRSLTVQAIDGELADVTSVDALAGRGLLIPAPALTRTRMHPRLMPQHFADVALTSTLRRTGYELFVDHRAESRQIDRAGSAVELGDSPRPSFNRKSSLYVPAVLTFWWQQHPPIKRPALLTKVLRIAIQGR